MVKKSDIFEDPEYALILSEYINWKKREKGENNFFADLLTRYGCKKVFESAMGDGFDSIHLIKAGFDVMSNDVNDTFISIATQNAGHHGIELKVTNYDWRSIPDSLCNQFDAVLNLGNSLTYLLKREDQLLALRNLTKIVRSGGIVFIDHRNYDYMLRNRQHILQNPLKNFRYSGKYYYSQDTIKAYPVAITENAVVMEYLNTQSGSAQKETFYPFRRQEMIELMVDAGLEVIESYGDFVLNRLEPVDFYQHVGIKQ